MFGATHGMRQFVLLIVLYGDCTRPFNHMHTHIDDLAYYKPAIVNGSFNISPNGPSAGLLCMYSNEYWKMTWKIAMQKKKIYMQEHVIAHQVFWSACIHVMVAKTSDDRTMENESCASLVWYTAPACVCIWLNAYMRKYPVFCSCCCCYCFVCCLVLLHSLHLASFRCHTKLQSVHWMLSYVHSQARCFKFQWNMHNTVCWISFFK